MHINTKTEIIYYTIPTDFELEFNINGCCPMRLLTETADDVNTLLNFLSRAFSRNRVVIITGPMNTGIVEEVAKAIGYATVKTDSEEFFHTESYLSALIENSVPLITESGILGGCIAESGQQALIMLTSEKAVQRELIKKLIEPYICAINKLENAEDTAEEESDEKSAEENNEVPEEEFFEEPTIIPEEDEEDIPEEDIPEKEDAHDEDENDVTSDVEALEDFVDDVFEDKKKRKNGLNIATLVLLIVLLTCVGVLVYLLVLVPLSTGTPILENLQNVINSLLGN